MSCGVPVIATNWSGVTAYLTESNGYPLQIDGLVEARGWKGHRWAEPSEQNLRERMREVYNNREEVRVKGIRAREDMVKDYSYEKFREILREELERIDKKLKQKGQKRKEKTDL